MLLNLLSNAAKFTKDGTIRLTAERHIADGGRDEVVFRVADTGVGMEPADVGRLFQPFVQVDSSSTRKHEGTGLGLAICRRLCELMGGSIAVESEPGVGTTFTVRLPARAAPPELPGVRRERLSGPAPAPPPDAATVMVVDDEPRTRALLERVLAREGYRVLTAPGGEAGVEAARRERPAAVVLDARAAGGAAAERAGGWAVLGALKADPATADIPVVMATVVDGQSRGVALAAADYAAGPLDPARLGVILRAYRAEPGAAVLRVEDDAAAREVTARHLRPQGWVVREAADGREAVAAVRAAPPAVILLDLLMPTMDGFEFVEALRREPAGRSIPVVVVTAADLSPADRARLAGSVQQVLQKGTRRRGSCWRRCGRGWRSAPCRGRPVKPPGRRGKITRRSAGMPIHDWTQVKSGIFHAFHHEWITEIGRALNRGLLPADYYALPEQVAGGVVPDVLTLRRPADDPRPAKPSKWHPGRAGTALRTARPKVRFHIPDVPKWYANKKKAVVIRHVSEHRPVALLEIVSPGNKDSRTSLSDFVEKTRDLLAAGVHVSLVDLFPPSRRDPEGIHPEVWGEDDDTFRFDPAKPLTCAAYVGGARAQAFVEPVAVGDRLPDLPIFLTAAEYVEVPLEATYQAAFEALPEYWQDVLASSAPRPRRRRR